MIISPEPIKRATIVESKVLGVLDMEDEGDKDFKILAVPNFYTHKYSNLQSIDKAFLEICKNFFAHYKDLSASGDRVKVFDWHDKKHAQNIIKERIIK